MNSMEAIIAITALTAAFGLLIGTVNAEKEGFLNASDQINAKAEALKCSAVINSIYSNNANDYNGILECTVKEKEIYSGDTLARKKSEIITDANLSENLQIKKAGHYFGD